MASLVALIDETAHGPDHPNVAISLSNLALVLRDLGEPGARPLLDRALRISETAHGPDHPTTAAVRRLVLQEP